jgi:hypothetical protein
VAGSPDPSAYERYFSNDVSPASGLTVTPLLITWTESDTIQDFDMEQVPDGSGDDVPPLVDGQGGAYPFLFAYNELDEIAAAGSEHSYHKGAFCTKVTIEPQTTDATTHLRVNKTYIQPGPNCQVQIDTYTQQTISNFDVNGDVANVEYAAATGAKFTLPKFPASIRIPKIVQAIRFTQYEVGAGAPPSDTKTSPELGRNTTLGDLAGLNIAVWNNDAIWGFNEGSLLYVGSRSFSEGVPVYRKEYTVLIDTKNGFDHFFALYHYENGLVPQDVKPILPESVLPTDGTITDTGEHNGAGAFVMLEGVAFKDLFSFLKPPIGTYVDKAP